MSKPYDIFGEMHGTDTVGGQWVVENVQGNPVKTFHYHPAAEKWVKEHSKHGDKYFIRRNKDRD